MESASNNTAAGIDGVVGVLIMTVAVDAAELAASTELPFLNLPIIKQIFDFLVKYVAGKISVALQNMVTFTVIDAQTSSEQSTYSQSVTNLQTALQSGDQNAINQAKNSVKNALSGLVGFDGSYTPH